MHFQVTEQSGDRLADIQNDIEIVLANIEVAVTDWHAMASEMDMDIERLEKTLDKSDPGNAEIVDFLKWTRADHFTFLGFREYVFGGKDKERVAVKKDCPWAFCRWPTRRTRRRGGVPDESAWRIEIVLVRGCPTRLSLRNRRSVQGSSFGAYGRHRRQGIRDQGRGNRRTGR